MWTRARMEFPTMQSVCRLRTVPGKNKRHMKEVAGLVSGVESGVSKERLGPEYNYRNWRSVRQHTQPQTITNESYVC